ncbi:hypothetical protein V1477_011535 [Vespula maculifrons]|uniref:Uncharacterized protein n=1 Tax=Vespula maculifrons TaxID=7453 RepID=A0ABD2BZG2_VESMC
MFEIFKLDFSCRNVIEGQLSLQGYPHYTFGDIGLYELISIRIQCVDDHREKKSRSFPNRYMSKF